MEKAIINLTWAGGVLAGLLAGPGLIQNGNTPAGLLVSAAGAIVTLYAMEKAVADMNKEE